MKNNIQKFLSKTESEIKNAYDSSFEQSTADGLSIKFPFVGQIKVILEIVFAVIILFLLLQILNCVKYIFPVFKKRSKVASECFI